MRSTQSDIGLNEMNCDGGEKHINGEQAAGAADEDELGGHAGVSDASDNGASVDGGGIHGAPNTEHEEENLGDLDLENGGKLNQFMRVFVSKGDAT